jgi:hypothetical protein
VVFLISKGNLRTALGAISQELLAACLATFGLGYYWVSRDLSKNRDLVRLGAIGKLLVFVVFFGHLILGNITLRLVLPSLVDLLFAILFLEFLACFKRNHSNLRENTGAFGRLVSREYMPSGPQVELLAKTRKNIKHAKLSLNSTNFS